MRPWPCWSDVAQTCNFGSQCVISPIVYKRSRLWITKRLRPDASKAVENPKQWQQWVTKPLWPQTAKRTLRAPLLEVPVTRCRPNLVENFTWCLAVYLISNLEIKVDIKMPKQVCINDSLFVNFVVRHVVRVLWWNMAKLANFSVLQFPFQCWLHQEGFTPISEIDMAVASGKHFGMVWVRRVQLCGNWNCRQFFRRFLNGSMAGLCSDFCC